MTDYELKRSIADIQSRIASLDAIVTAARRAQPRPAWQDCRTELSETASRAALPLHFQPTSDPPNVDRGFMLSLPFDASHQH